MRAGMIRKRVIPYALTLAMLFGGTASVYAESTEPETDTAAEDLQDEDVQESSVKTEKSEQESSGETEESVTEVPEETNETDDTEEPDGPVYYTVHIGDGIENGSILIAGQKEDLQAEENTVIHISAVPDEDYELGSISVRDAEEQEIETETVTEGSEYTFVMPASDVTVTGSFSEKEKQGSKSTDTQDCSEQAEVTMDVLDETEDESMLDTVSNITITMSGFISYSEEGLGSGYDACFGVAEGDYEGNSNAYCLNSAVQAPGHDNQGTAVTYNVTTKEYTDPMLLKLMYYGFGGPGDITASYADTVTARHAITHMALVKRAAELGISGAGDYTYRASSMAIGLADQLYAAVEGMKDVTGSVSVLTPVTDLQTLILLSKVGPSEGELSLTKTSALVSITDGNPCYSLKGAVYYVYSDASCTTKAGEFTTGSDGKSTETLKLAEGTYYVKEQTASKGYLLDETVYKASVTAGGSSTVKVTEQPGNDPVTVLVEKIDAVTGEADEALQGAQFTVKYYAVESEDAMSSADPDAEWVFETNEKGVIRLADSYKVSGDALYTGTTGSPVLPLGYISIQETKAPEGYQLNSTVYVCATTEKNNTVITTNLPTGDNAVKETPGDVKIKTTAKDSQTGTHVGTVSSEAVITDFASYEGVIIGQTYTMRGILMNRETGEPLLVNGKEVTAETEFTADSINGSVGLTYRLDASALAGTTVVVFETLYRNGIEVCSHADLSSEEQSVHYPEIHTTASVNGAKEAEVSRMTVLTDTISFSNLIAGQTYTVKGILMDQKTGSELIVNGSIVESESQFTAETSDGSIDVDFTFDSTGLGGSTLVVFERMYNSSNVEIAAHTDLSSQDQTVVLKAARGTITTSGGKTVKTATAKATGTAPDTGDKTDIIFSVIGLVFGLICIVFVVLIWRRILGKK